VVRQARRVCRKMALLRLSPALAHLCPSEPGAKPGAEPGAEPASESTSGKAFGKTPRSGGGTFSGDARAEDQSAARAGAWATFDWGQFDFTAGASPGAQATSAPNGASGGDSCGGRGRNGVHAAHRFRTLLQLYEATLPTCRDFGQLPKDSCAGSQRRGLASGLASGLARVKVVRNPFARAVSTYLWHGRHGFLGELVPQALTAGDKQGDKQRDSNASFAEYDNGRGGRKGARLF